MSHPNASDATRGPSRQEWFPTTHWSVVLAARAQGSPQAAEALEKLCRTYWYPLYAYVRRRGYTSEDAQDLTQEFFARLLRKNYPAQADRAKSKFRSFLLLTLNHFLADEHDRTAAQRRGGGQIDISLDEPSPHSSLAGLGLHRLHRRHNDLYRRGDDALSRFRNRRVEHDCDRNDKLAPR